MPVDARSKVVRQCDVVQPTSITMSGPPIFHKSSWTSKVNSFLYEISIRAPLDGILHERLPLCYARYHMTSTNILGDAEEAQASRPSKAYAWKRRRKRQDAEEEVSRRYYRPARLYYRAGGTTAPSAAENPPLRPCAAVPPVLPPAPAVLPLGRAVLPPVRSQTMLWPAPAVLPPGRAVLPLLREPAMPLSLVTSTYPTYFPLLSLDYK